MSKGDEDDFQFNDNQNKYFNSSLLRGEHEFYKEEEDIAYKMITVKRTNLKKGEDWEISEDKKVTLILKGVRFTNKEKEYMRTVDGMNFIINGYKKGLDSVVKFKKELKKAMK